MEPDSPDEQAAPGVQEETDGPHSSVCDFSHPRLAHIELVELLPSTFFRTLPLISNLTRLRLACFFSSLESMSKLLSENPRLELLEIDIGAFGRGNLRELLDLATLDRLRISLPLLSDFSLKISTHHMCGIQLLKIIDAPNVEHLELNFSIDRGDAEYLYDDGNWSIPAYLAKGREHGVLQSLTIPTKDIGCGPIFPLVQKLSLNVSNYSTSWQPKAHADLFSASPNITYLATDYHWISAMLDKPYAYPRLEDVTFHVPPQKDDIRASLQTMASYVLARSNAGLPISTLRIYTSAADLFKTLEQKAKDPSLVATITEKERFRTKESVILLYSLVDTLVFRNLEPQFSAQSRMKNGEHQELEATTETENAIKIDSSDDEGEPNNMERGPVMGANELDYIQTLIGRL
jgi:hypothetical protein